MPASTFFSPGKVQTIPPHPTIYYSTPPGKTPSPKHPPTFAPHSRQGHSQATHLRQQQSPPTGQQNAREQTSCADRLPLPARSVALPAPCQAKLCSGQHSAGEQERAGTARQACTGERFSAPTRKSPVQATSHARQPAPAARRYLFQSSFYTRPTPFAADSGFAA